MKFGKKNRNVGKKLKPIGKYSKNSILNTTKIRQVIEKIVRKEYNKNN